MAEGIKGENAPLSLGASATGSITDFFSSLGALNLLGGSRGISSDPGSFVSCKDVPSASSFYSKEIASSWTEADLPLEVETEPVEIKTKEERSFLGNIAFILKASCLLPFVIIGALLKGILHALLSAFEERRI